MWRYCTLLLVSAYLASASEQVRFEIGYDSIHIEERGIMTVCVLFDDADVYGFVPMPGMRHVIDAPKRKVTLTHSDLTTTVTLQFVEGKLLRGSSFAERLRQQVQTRYPQGRIIEEADCYSADGKGLSFDVEFEVENILRKARVCFVPVLNQNKTAVFVLATTPQNFAACHLPFLTTVGSFATRTVEKQVSSVEVRTADQ